MVQIFKHDFVYNYDFPTVSYAYLNRYPNPYASHVLTVDTLESFVDDKGNLRLTKLIMKTGRLPKFIKPFLGTNLNSWIIEKTIINPKGHKLLTYSANIDHRKFIKVEEFLTFTQLDRFTTVAHCLVKFSSNYIGLKQKIEEWGRNKFSANVEISKKGLSFVMSEVKAKKLNLFKNY